MNQVQLCLFAVVAFSCLTHLVTPFTMVIDGDSDYDTNEPVPITEGIFDLKDKSDLFDPSTVLLTRLRRNTAQWVQGSQHYNDYNAASSRRFAHRRRSNGGGQIMDS